MKMVASSPMALRLIAHVGIPCIEIFVTEEMHVVSASSASYQALLSLFSRQIQFLGDGVVAAAMQENTCE